MTKRARAIYPALDPTLNLKIRYDEIADIDYLSKLNAKEKAWLNTFMAESVNASFKKDTKEHLHDTPELKKACYDRNNARNRDIYSRAKAQDSLTNLEWAVNKEEVISSNDEFELSNDWTSARPKLSVFEELDDVENNNGDGSQGSDSTE